MAHFGVKTRNLIINIIDFFYPPFKKFFSIQFFRYGVSGASNMVLDWILYYLFYHYVFFESVVNLGFIAFTPYVASFIFTFPITFATGFLLSKYVSFSESELKGTTQLIRYGMVVVACILINYVVIKVCVESLGFFATPSKMIASVFTTLFSYFSQKYFTFKA